MERCASGASVRSGARAWNSSRWGRHGERASLRRRADSRTRRWGSRAGKTGAGLAAIFSWWSREGQAESTAPAPWETARLPSWADPATNFMPLANVRCATVEVGEGARSVRPVAESLPIRRDLEPSESRVRKRSKPPGATRSPGRARPRWVSRSLSQHPNRARRARARATRPYLVKGNARAVRLGLTPAPVLFTKVMRICR